MNKRYILKNKARFYIFLTLIFLTVFTVFTVTKAYSYKETEYRVITIRSGDTLWSIAERYNKKGDIRDYIYKLKELNNLEDSGIIAGNELKVIVE